MLPCTCGRRLSAGADCVRPLIHSQQPLVRSHTLAARTQSLSHSHGCGETRHVRAALRAHCCRPAACAAEGRLRAARGARSSLSPASRRVQSGYHQSGSTLPGTPSDCVGFALQLKPAARLHAPIYGGTAPAGGRGHFGSPPRQNTRRLAPPVVGRRKSPPGARGSVCSEFHSLGGAALHPEGPRGSQLAPAIEPDWGLYECVRGRVKSYTLCGSREGAQWVALRAALRRVRAQQCASWATFALRDH